jgi:SAM-dependent methyltransferase
MTRPQTWHHGLIAEWWAGMNLDGPEIETYRPFVEQGQPALDAGCGAGRLLVPWRRAGLEVDGCDASQDMVDRCRDRLRAEGLDAALWTAPLHELAPPRAYRTVIVCGAFGLGSTRAQDERAIEVLFEALEPGGTLILDNEVPYSSPRRWSWWAERPELPQPWPREPDRGTAPDGAALALWSRTVDVDPLDQSVRLEIRAEKLVHGVVVAGEQHELTMRMWFRDELVLALRHAGFRSVEVDEGADPSILVYVARK